MRARQRREQRNSGPSLTKRTTVRKLTSDSYDSLLIDISIQRKHLQSKFSLTHAERVAEGEFIEAVQSNEAALRLIQYDHK